MDVLLLNNTGLEYRSNSSIPVNIRAIAHRIAGILDGEVIQDGRDVSAPTFVVPYAAVTTAAAREHRISGNGDVYGGIVRESEQADKAALHKLIRTDAQYPNWYSPRFADSITQMTLPGFTAFSVEDAMQAFYALTRSGMTVRCKDPSNTGGVGQAKVETGDELEAFVSEFCNGIARKGVVIETDVTDPSTATVGRLDLLGQHYSWFGRPYDVQHGGQTRFGGNELTVVRGGFDALLPHISERADVVAIEQSAHVLSAYDRFGVVIPRGALDVVQGTTENGGFVSGITDPSFRPSGSSAAELKAVEALSAHPGAEVATTRVSFDYSNSRSTTAVSPDDIFAVHERVTIFVDLLSLA